MTVDHFDLLFSDLAERLAAPVTRGPAYSKIEAVREAKGEDAADRIAGLKKSEMVTAAEDLLSGTAG